MMCVRARAVDEASGSLSVPLPDLPHENLPHREWVHQQGGDAPQRAVGLVKDAQLPEQRCPVVVDPLTGQAFIIVECKDPAKRKLDLSTGWRQPAPRPEV